MEGTTGTRTVAEPAGRPSVADPARASRAAGVSSTMARKSGGPNPWDGHFERKRVPEGVWMRCDRCGATLVTKQVVENLYVCLECNHHFTVSAAERIDQILDADTFEEWFADLRPGDPLEFNDRRPYPERVKAEQERTGLSEAAVVGQGFIKGIRVVFGVTDSSFIMGSMGSVVGEKLTRAIEEATRQELADHHRLRVGRRGPDARGHLVVDADGQGVSSHRPPQRRRRPLHQRPDPPHHGRRRRELRLARAISSSPSPGL